jgi:hypothetical protein
LMISTILLAQPLISFLKSLLVTPLMIPATTSMAIWILGSIEMFGIEILD